MKKFLALFLALLCVFCFVGCDKTHAHEFINGVCSCGEKEDTTNDSNNQSVGNEVTEEEWRNAFTFENETYYQMETVQIQGNFKSISTLGYSNETYYYDHKGYIDDELVDYFTFIYEKIDDNYYYEYVKNNGTTWERKEVSKNDNMIYMVISTQAGIFKDSYTSFSFNNESKCYELIKGSELDIYLISLNENFTKLIAKFDGTRVIFTDLESESTVNHTDGSTLKQSCSITYNTVNYQIPTDFVDKDV